MANHELRVADARRIKHPQHPNIEKHVFLVNARDLPYGISDDPNAREAKGLNRRVYRDIRKNLTGQEVYPDIFDLMNKGITILAEKVIRHNDKSYSLVINDGQGIVDGGHTYKIICDANKSNEIPENQFVDVHVRTGIPDNLVTEIARGLNTGMQVKPHSLANLDGKYDWIKDEITDEPYADYISWREDDDGVYDVRDLICVMEAMNIHDFPNEGSKHPIHSYEKWSAPTEKFSKDQDTHVKDPTKSVYYSIKPLLKDALFLFDTIRRDFKDIYNNSGLGQAGNLDIVEKAKGNRLYDFHFSGEAPSSHRLTKGALYPIFAAFRNKVVLNPETRMLEWEGGFDSVLELWKKVGPTLCAETKDAVKDIGNKPDQIGKNRGHWSKLHQTVEVYILREQVRRLPDA